MLIIEQGRDSVTNTDHFGTIEIDGNSIMTIRWNNTSDQDDADDLGNYMGTYDTPERAQEVFGMIINAVMNEKKVFVMPEE